MDICYYSIIERSADGSFAAWVPDLPGVTAGGATEEEVRQRIFRNVRECLRNLTLTGQPIPASRSVDELPQRDQHELRRLLLIIS